MSLNGEGMISKIANISAPQTVGQFNDENEDTCHRDRFGE